MLYPLSCGAPARSQYMSRATISHPFVGSPARHERQQAAALRPAPGATATPPARSAPARHVGQFAWDPPQLAMPGNQRQLAGELSARQRGGGELRVGKPSLPDAERRRDGEPAPRRNHGRDAKGTVELERAGVDG